MHKHIFGSPIYVKGLMLAGWLFVAFILCWLSCMLQVPRLISLFEIIDFHSGVPRSKTSIYCGGFVLTWLRRGVFTAMMMALFVSAHGQFWRLDFEKGKSQMTSRIENPRPEAETNGADSIVVYCIITNELQAWKPSILLLRNDWLCKSFSSTSTTDFLCYCFINRYLQFCMPISSNHVINQHSDHENCLVRIIDEKCTLNSRIFSGCSAVNQQ